jgi:hypothetical protein
MKLTHPQNKSLVVELVFWTLIHAENADFGLFAV